MNREQDIEKLFKKFQENTITEEEYHRLMDWIKASGSESRIRSWMDARWEELKKNGDLPERNTISDARFRELMEKADKRHKIHRPEYKNKGAYYKLAAVLVLFLAIAGTMYYRNLNRTQPPPPEMVTQHISGGKKATVTLPDGTVVRLNSGSELTFPDRFPQNTREVVLQGEAFFDVVKDKKRPFIVRTGELTTRVLGTSFNVRAYENDGKVEVSVATGLVRVSGKTDKDAKDSTTTKQQLLLSPSQQAVYRPEEKSFTKRKIDINSIALWKDGILSFDKTPLDEAAKMLERWYGVKVILENPELKHCVIRGRHKNESLANVLHTFQYSLGITYKITKDNVIISGKSCRER